MAAADWAFSAADVSSTNVKHGVLTCNSPVLTKPERKVPLTQRLQQPHSLQYCRVVLTDFELLVIQLIALCTTDCPNHMDCIVSCSMTSWVPNLCSIPVLGWHLAPHKQTYPFRSPLGIFSSKVSGSCDLLRSPVDLRHHRWVLISFSYPSVRG